MEQGAIETEEREKIQTGFDQPQEKEEGFGDEEPKTEQKT